MALIEKLRAIGDAIRAKTGSTEEMTLTEMAEAVAGIPMGESLPQAEGAYFGGVEIEEKYFVQGETLNGIAEEVQRITGTTDKMTTTQIITALQNLSFILQDKTVAPTTEVQTITPDEGYYGLSSVTVEAAAVVENLQDLSEVPF